jgi:hypothetical protein
MPGGDALRHELEVVRKGRGVQEPQIRDRMGPVLRGLCGVDGATSHGEARRALVARLDGVTGELPGDLGLAVRTMFALTGTDPRHRFLKQRYETLSRRWNCDFRTVQRRCDEAMALICDRLDGPVVPVAPNDADRFDPDTWYVELFRAVVLLDRVPEAIEERTIVATADGLRQIGLPFGLPRHPDERRQLLDVDLGVLYGAEPDSIERVGDTLFVQHLSLPRSLRRGERHVYARHVRLPGDQAMVPRFVHQVIRRCDTFELRVKFAADAPPRVVWVVSREPELAYAAHRPGPHRVTPDRLGEVAVRFTDLRPGFGYGLAWLPGPP